ncbi:MAG: CinA family protein [Oscillospiraceae bacterium]|nr:CinA family protein [Oscillospiraceae bacterium]
MEMYILAQNVVETLKTRGLRVAFAESCTGGMLAAAITSVPGSSAVLDMSIITYANSAKIEYTDVTQNDLDIQGAVSERIARLMASGIRRRSGADIGVGITGIAGAFNSGCVSQPSQGEQSPPFDTGASVEKPVGTVYIAIDSERSSEVRHCVFAGDRQSVREQTTQFTLEVLHDYSLRQTPCKSGQEK